MLKYRLITGPILIALLLGIVMLDAWLETLPVSGGMQRFFGGADHVPRGLAFFVAALLIAILAARELAVIIERSGMMTRTWLIALAAVLGLTVSYVIPHDTPAIEAAAIVASACVVLVVISIVTFCQGQRVEGVLAGTAGVLFAMVYLGLMLGFLLALRREHSAWWIVGVLLTTKSCDIGAYFTGRAIGRHKLIVWLSPGKTWEGLVGGVITSGLVGLGLAALSHRLPAEIDHVHLLLGGIAGLTFGLVGQGGDLIVSLFKRGSDLKDSSSLLPGMGGILDVIDSPLLVAPIAYWLLMLNAAM